VDEADRLGPQGEDRLLQVVEEETRELLLGLALGAVVAVRVVDMPHLGHQRLERRADGGDPVQ
jgi:hypothetical protein